MKRNFVILTAIILAVSFIAVWSAAAVQKEGAAKPKQNFMQKVVKYPANVVKDSGKAVVNATKGTANVVTTTSQDTASVLTGDVSKTRDMLEKPITGTAETVGAAAKESISAPIEAAQETAQE